MNELETKLKALESGAARVINIKTGRVSGQLESRKIHGRGNS